MCKIVHALVLRTLLTVLVTYVSAQSNYQVVSLASSGKIAGTVTWSGALPHVAPYPINKDSAVCDPNSQKTRDLERLIIGRRGGVANTVVFLKNVTSGKPMKFPEARQFLNQKQCRYEPHVLLVGKDANLQMKSSDPVLHTIHMDGAATYNLPFPFTNQTVSRSMSTPGLVNLRCNGGHVWMNAEVIVAPHPYYAVTDESGTFELTEVPPGEYEIVAWHEGWSLIREESAFDVLTERKVKRPIFSEARTWRSKAVVRANETSTVDFAISEK
jgi:hypothetical protein